MLNFSGIDGDYHGDMVPPQSGSLSQNGVPSAILHKGNSLFSPSNGFRLFLQEDGNAVIQTVHDAILPRAWLSGEPIPYAEIPWSDPPIWNSGTNDQGVTQIAMQNDGNLVAYSGSGPTGDGPSSIRYQRKSWSISQNAGRR